MCRVCGHREHGNDSLRPLRRRRLVVRSQQENALSPCLGIDHNGQVPPQYARSFKTELDGAGCFTFEEFSVGSEAEGFQHAGLHLFCEDRKSTRLNSSHSQISYAVFCLKKKKTASTSTIATSPR